MRSLRLVPLAAISAVQPSMRWSPVILPPRHAVRDVTVGEEVRAKAGIAVSKVTRQTAVLAAPRPILILFNLAIIRFRADRCSQSKTVSLVCSAGGSVHVLW